VPRDELVIGSRSPFLGAKVANLSPALAEELRIDAKAEGVAVIDVPDNSIAARYGFRRGDVIVIVNGEPIAKTRDLERAAGEATRTWSVTILRGGQRISAEFRG
jgi:S1-C subfamily serine protease